MRGAEEFAEAVACKVLDDVVELTAAVVTLSGVSFGVFVREDGSDRFKDGFADYVLGCDKLQTVYLTSVFFLDKCKDFGIMLCKI